MSSSFVNRLVGVAFGAVIAFLSAGCDSSSPPVTRIGCIGWPGYEPLALAEQLEYFKPAPHRILEYTSSTQVLRAFRNNTIEVAAMTLGEAVELAKDIPEIRVILVLDTSVGADVVLGRPGVTNLTQLRGRRVAYEPTALGAYMLGRALTSAGLEPKDATLVVSQLDEHERMFTNGRVDAIVTFEPVRSHLLATGANILFSSAQIPDEIVDVLVVRQDLLTANPEAVKTILRGVFKAQQYQKNSAGQADRLSCTHLGLTAEQLRNCYQLIKLPDLAANQRLLCGHPPALLAPAKRLAAVMVEQGILDRSPELNQLMDGSLLGQLDLGN